jgi:hypothetical protein
MTEDEIEDRFVEGLAEIIEGVIEDMADHGMSPDEIKHAMNATFLPRFVVGVNAILRGEPAISTTDH